MHVTLQIEFKLKGDSLLSMIFMGPPQSMLYNRDIYGRTREAPNNLGSSFTVLLLPFEFCAHY